MHPSPTSRRGMTIAITSGKGGVGKTSLTINLATALASMGHCVGILDADLGLGNVDVMLGLTPRMHLGAVIAGDKSVAEILADVSHGIRVAAAGSGIPSLRSLTSEQKKRLVDGIDRMAAGLDFLLLDTAPGICDDVLEIAALTDRTIVVTSCEPTAIVDAYAMIKLLWSVSPDQEIGLVINQVPDGAVAQLVFRQLDETIRRFLGRSSTYDGHVDRDPNVSRAIIKQGALVTLLPESPASRCYRTIAHRIASLPVNPPRADDLGPRHGTITPEEFERMEAPRCA
jgi:flagellar biosynthesis protein FlhG